MILIGYDGSADAEAAIDDVAKLMPGADAAVLTVWKAFEPTVDYHGGLRGEFGYTGPLGHAPNEDFEGWDRTLEAAAIAKAQEGVERAVRAGLRATPRVAERLTSTADAIIDAAGGLDASAIVLGSRGLTGARSWIMGSVSQAVLQHADRPVIVVPAPEVARRRAEQRWHVAAAGTGS